MPAILSESSAAGQVIGRKIVEDMMAEANPAVRDLKAGVFSRLQDRVGGGCWSPRAWSGTHQHPPPPLVACPYRLNGCVSEEDWRSARRPPVVKTIQSSTFVHGEPKRQLLVLKKKAKQSGRRANGGARDLQHRPPPLTRCGMCERAFDEQIRRTTDHVFPRGFFGEPPPPNLPTWRVCSACQHALSSPEERLRSLFAAGHSHHPNDVRTVLEKAARSAQRPEVIARKLVAAPSGVLVPASIAVPRADDLHWVFTKVCRGLYWWRHHMLPTDSRLVVRLMPSDAFTQWSMLLIGHGKQPVQRLGSEVWWVSATGPPNEGWCIWLFVIFGAVPVGVWYGRAAELPNIPSAAGVALREPSG